MTRCEVLGELFAQRESEGRPISIGLRTVALDEAALWDAFDDYCERAFAELDLAPLPDTFRR